MSGTFFGVVIKNTWLFLMAMVASATVQADELGKEQEAKQAELDAACEVAR